MESIRKLLAWDSTANSNRSMDETGFGLPGTKRNLILEMLLAIKRAAQYQTWCTRDPETASKIAQIKAHFRLDQKYTTGRGRQKVDTGIALTEAISKLKAYGSTDPRRASARITLNLVCRLTKSTNNGFRGFFTLPHLVPKEDEAVLVFCPPSQTEAAMKTGAKYAGGAELMGDIVDGKLKFTRCLATPEMIPTVTKLARILGPMGMMPNVKHGTLTTDIPGAISKCLSNVPYHICKMTGVMNICAAKVRKILNLFLD